MRGGSRSGMICAFVRFNLQQSAQSATEHGYITLRNVTEPLVVRWADSAGNRRREGRDYGRNRRQGGHRDSSSEKWHSRMPMMTPGYGRYSGQYGGHILPMPMQMPLQQPAMPHGSMSTGLASSPYYNQLAASGGTYGGGSSHMMQYSQPMMAYGPTGMQSACWMMSPMTQSPQYMGTMMMNMLASAQNVGSATQSVEDTPGGLMGTTSIEHTPDFTVPQPASALT